MKIYSKIHKLRLAELRLRRTFAPNHRTCYSLSNGLKFVLHPGDLLSEHIYLGRAYELLETEFVNRYLSQGEFALDIGANVGYFTSIMSQKVGPAGLVLSFEPGTSTFPKLQQTIELMDLTNVVAYPYALWCKDQLISFFNSTDGDDAQQSVQVREKTNGKTFERSVAAFRGDTFLQSNSSMKNKVPSFIKIDVEGGETQVIQGLAETIQQFAPVLLIEYNTEALANCGNDPGELIALLAERHTIYFAKLSWPSWWTDQPRFLPLSAIPTSTCEANLLCIPHAGNHRERALGSI